jgi:DNA-binding NarL/FixJ family response regulator
MRILVCDHHIVFAESLAHVLAILGNEVVVNGHPDEAAVVLGREHIDVCVLGVRFGPDSAVDRLAELRACAPRTRIVLLAEGVDRALLAAAEAAGVSAIADKCQRVSEIIDLLRRIHAGEPVPARARVECAAPGRRPRVANDAQRLAAFLTPRERQVLSALVCGEDTTKLARSLGITATTARCHIQSVLTKMGAHSRLEVATTAVRSGMVCPQTGEWLIR